MAVLGPVSTILPVAPLLARLRAAARGVVLVRREGDTAGVATGWLVTPDLVVIHDYRIDRTARYLCRLYDDGPAGAVGATPLPAPPDAPSDNTGPALLRLDRSEPDRVLRLGPAGVELHHPVFLLHHPQGQPDQAVSFGRLVEADGRWLT